jgi:hypothetical protein
MSDSGRTLHPWNPRHDAPAATPAAVLWKVEVEVEGAAHRPLYATAVHYTVTTGYVKLLTCQCDVLTSQRNTASESIEERCSDR